MSFSSKTQNYLNSLRKRLSKKQFSSSASLLSMSNAKNIETLSAHQLFRPPLRV